MDMELTRRDLFKKAGILGAALALSGCGNRAEQRLVPFLKPPEEQVAGVFTYYAKQTVHRVPRGLRPPRQDHGRPGAQARGQPATPAQPGSPVRPRPGRPPGPVQPRPDPEPPSQGRRAPGRVGHDELGPGRHPADRGDQAGGIGRQAGGFPGRAGARPPLQAGLAPLAGGRATVGGQTVADHIWCGRQRAG